MSDHDDIRRSIALYCQLLDDKRFDEWGDLFTADGVFEARGNRWTGRGEIVAALSQMLATGTTKHLIGATVIDVSGPGEALAWTDLTTFVVTGDGPAIATVGRYHDQLHRDADGRWRFAVRILVLAGDPPRPDVTPPPSR